MSSFYLTMLRCAILGLALAFAGGYVGDLGASWFPAYEKYVRGLAAFAMVVPMIYFVFVPVFEALSREEERRKAARESKR